jgi:hypothetical protein
MNRIKTIILSLFSLTFFVACADSAQIERPETPLQPTLSVTISSNEAMLFGQVVTPGGKPLSDTEIRLAFVVWNSDKSEGAYIIEGGSSPTTITNTDGVFIFNNLRPGDYAIIVGDIFSQNIAIAHPDGRAVVYEVEIGSALNAGIMEVDFASVPMDLEIPTPFLTAPAYPVPATVQPKPTSPYP